MCLPREDEDDDKRVGDNIEPMTVTESKTMTYESDSESADFSGSVPTFITVFSASGRYLTLALQITFWADAMIKYTDGPRSPLPTS